MIMNEQNVCTQAELRALRPNIRKQKKMRYLKTHVCNARAVVGWWQWCTSGNWSEGAIYNQNQVSLIKSADARRST